MYSTPTEQPWHSIPTEQAYHNTATEQPNHGTPSEQSHYSTPTEHRHELARGGSCRAARGGRNRWTAVGRIPWQQHGPLECTSHGCVGGCARALHAPAHAVRGCVRQSGNARGVCVCVGWGAEAERECVCVSVWGWAYNTVCVSSCVCVYGGPGLHAVCGYLWVGCVCCSLACHCSQQHSDVVASLRICLPMTCRHTAACSVTTSELAMHIVMWMTM